MRALQNAATIRRHDTMCPSTRSRPNLPRGGTGLFLTDGVRSAKAEGDGERVNAAGFAAWADANGLDLPERAISLLAAYEERLRVEAERQSLIGRSTLADAWRTHILDSLLLLAEAGPEVPRGTSSPWLPRNGRLFDLGSGAGLPGVPLKIVRPDLDVYLCEPRRRRATFLREVEAALALPGLHVLCTRAEVAGRDTALRETFDVVTARAVSELAVLIELGLPLLSVGGVLVAYKGPSYEAETDRAVTACREVGGELERVRESALPEGGEKRSLLFVRKVRNTPSRFPRRAGVPEKRPLGTVGQRRN
jgi:16S rRNA (guanine527-N7)-methyltransferase